MYSYSSISLPQLKVHESSIKLVAAQSAPTTERTLLPRSLCLFLLLSPVLRVLGYLTSNAVDVLLEFCASNNPLLRLLLLMYGLDSASGMSGIGSLDVYTPLEGR